MEVQKQAKMTTLNTVVPDSLIGLVGLVPPRLFGSEIFVALKLYGLN